MGEASKVKRVSILIPVYNERPYIRRCVESVLAAALPAGLGRELLIIDDGSTDGTDKVLSELAAEHPETIRVLTQPRRLGKGAALQRAVGQMHGDFAIIQDGDLEYDPNDYATLLAPLVEGHADVVFGSRFVTRRMRRVLNYHHALGNWLLTHLSNLFTGLNLTDMETCYKAFRADVLRTIPIRSRGFGIEPELTAKIAKRQCMVYEVPISYFGRSYDQGKKIHWTDGVVAAWTILKYWLIDDCYNERYGQEILSSLSQARRFHQWMVDVVKPKLGDRILEIGSGIGNISRQLPKRERLTVSDMDDVYLELLGKAFDGNALVDVAKVDLTHDADFEPLAGQYDTVVCLNVLEHIEDDVGALKRMRTALCPGGMLVLLVPQYQALYGSFDEQLGHCRRYDRSMIRKVMAEAGYEIDGICSFNALAMLGWYVNAVLLKSRKMGKMQLKFYDMLVPVLKLTEKCLPFLPGLSVICFARRPKD